MSTWPKCSPDLSKDARLADEGDEDEKASQQVQAVYKPEKYLKLIIHLQTVGMIAVKYVVGHGEHPEDTKDKEHLGIQHLA